MKKKFIAGIIVAFVGFGWMVPTVSAMDNRNMNVDEARSLLSTGYNIQARYESVNVTQEDPQMAIAMSSEGIQYGVSWALQNIKKYTTNQDLIDVATKMGDVFKSGNMFLPDSDTIADNNFKDAVQQVFDIVLNTFCWEDGHTTEVTATEVAAHMITRARLVKLQSLWK